MASTKQQSGLCGVYLVAAELSRHGFNVAPTARNAAGADLLVFDPETAQAVSVEVKTSAKRVSFWLVGERATRRWPDTHFYVFVNNGDAQGDRLPEYYVVPGAVVSAGTMKSRSRTGSVWHSFKLTHARPYRDGWSQLRSIPAQPLRSEASDSEHRND